MNVNLSISATLNNSSNQFVIAAYSDKGLTTLVEQQNPTKPYSNPFQVTFTTLSANIMYYFALWESPDGTASGTIRNTCNFQPSSQSVNLRADLWLTADVTSGFASGSSGYTDPTNSLAGWDYDLQVPGYGPYQSGVDYTLDSNNNFALTGGNTVQPGQRMVLIFKPQISQGAASTPALITSSVTLTTTTNLNSTYKNKAILLQGAAASFIVNLPALSTMTDFDVLYFYSYGGSHKNVSIRCYGTDKIQRNTQVTKIVLAQNEVLKLFRVTISGTSYWYVDGSLPGLDSVGQFVETYDLSGFLNAIPLDGSLVSRATYERLWDKVSSYGSGILISDSNFNNVDGNGNYINKGFFTTGDGSTTFRVPDLRLYPTRRVVDGSVRIAGSFEDELVGSHDHTMHGQGAITGGGHSWYLSASGGNRYSGSGGDSFGGVQTTPDANTRTGKNTATENRTRDTGTYLLIRI